MGWLCEIWGSISSQDFARLIFPPALFSLNRLRERGIMLVVFSIHPFIPYLCTAFKFSKHFHICCSKSICLWRIRVAASSSYKTKICQSLESFQLILLLFTVHIHTLYIHCTHTVHVIAHEACIGEIKVMFQTSQFYLSHGYKKKLFWDIIPFSANTYNIQQSWAHSCMHIILSN